MAAIQDLKGLLEPKLDTVTVDVTLLRADLKKVVEKVTTAETDIACLQTTSKRLESQVKFLTKEHKKIMALLEDQEARARRNNIKVVGLPEGAEDPSVEFFLETLNTDSLHPKGLSTIFTIERAYRAPVPSPPSPAPTRGPSNDNYCKNIQFLGQGRNPAGRKIPG
ncbi:hypothetical protein NDU88_002473 [Pleurodeles waltl]|uniref:Uncharacterized protein n=1 Tax=Pleurodeles waltl TaxID=8319 RepID=A0AAV7UA08_PLEWA|nr:hypothetical protein NDU88_002473 [Pleurodeles waltl]